MNTIHTRRGSPSSSTEIGSARRRYLREGDQDGGPLPDRRLQPLPGDDQIGVGAERGRVEEGPAAELGHVDLHDLPAPHGGDGVVDVGEPEVAGQVVQGSRGDDHERHAHLERPLPSGADRPVPTRDPERGHAVIGLLLGQHPGQLAAVLELDHLRPGEPLADRSGGVLAQRWTRSAVDDEGEAGPIGRGVIAERRRLRRTSAGACGATGHGRRLSRAAPAPAAAAAAMGARDRVSLSVVVMGRAIATAMGAAAAGSSSAAPVANAVAAATRLASVEPWPVARVTTEPMMVMAPADAAPRSAARRPNLPPAHSAIAVPTSMALVDRAGGRRTAYGYPGAWEPYRTPPVDRGDPAANGDGSIASFPGRTGSPVAGSERVSDAGMSILRARVAR